MSTRKLFRRTFDLGSIEQPELDSTGPLSQHPVPSLDERANIYLRAVCGSRDLAGEEFSRARLRILDAMAEQIALEVPAARPTPLPLGETSGRDAGTAITSYGYSESGAAYCGEDDTTDQSVDFENVSPVTRRDFSDEPEAARLMPLACVAQIDDREMYSLRTNVSDKRIPTSPHRGRRWGAKAIAACAFVALAGVAALVSHGGLSERWSATDQRVAVHRQPAEKLGAPIQMESLSPEMDKNSDSLKLREITSPRFSVIETAPSVPAPPRADELMERGRELIRAGDILAARLVLARATEAGSALAALELGGTYDPVILGQVRRPQTAVTAVRANPPAEIPTSIELARVWYQRAKALGSIEAVERLNRLPAAERRK